MSGCDASWKRADVLALLAVWLVTVLAYLPVWHAAFVYDDFDYVVHNRLATARPLDWRAVFNTPYPPDHPEQKLYRPLVTLSYALDYRVWGLPASPAWSPTRFHLTNLILHLVVTGLVFALLRTLLPVGLSRWVIACATAFVALHPVATEAVAWVSGRAELLAAAFGLASVLLALRAVTGAPWWAAGALVAYALALLSKENAIVVPLLWLVVLGWRVYAGQARWGGRRCLWLTAGYGLVAVSYIGWRMFVFRGIELAQVAYAEVNSPMLRWLTAVKVSVRYLGLVFVPYRQSVFHEVRAEWAGGIAALLVVAAIVGMLWFWRQRLSWLTAGLLWFAVALLPVSNLVIRIGSVMAERFLYLPLAGLALSVGLGLSEWKQRGALPRWVTMLLVAVLAHHGIKTFVRSGDWHNELTLWASAAQVYPTSFLPHAQLGFAALAAGDGELARASLQKARMLIQTALTTVQERFGPRLTAAWKEAQRLPARPSAELAAIHAVARSGQLAEAAHRYEEYLRRHPTDRAAMRALADCYLELRQYERAQTLLQQLLADEPDNGWLHGKLGLALAGLGDEAAARTAYERALALDADDVIAAANLAALEMKQEDWASARMRLERVVQLQPNFTSARFNLAVCLYRLNEWALARQHLRAILTVQPNHAEAMRLLQILDDASVPPANR